MTPCLTWKLRLPTWRHWRGQWYLCCSFKAYFLKRSRFSRRYLTSYISVLNKVSRSHRRQTSANGGIEEMKDARMCTTVLLSTLYNRILNAQTAGRIALCEALSALFNRSLDPFTRLVDDWLFCGSLAGDIAQEFFVSRYISIGLPFKLTLTAAYVCVCLCSEIMKY